VRVPPPDNDRRRPGGEAASTVDYPGDGIDDGPTVPQAAPETVPVGDFDPSGEDIDRDFAARTGCWDKVVRVALNAEQVQQYSLPPNPGKSTDSRAGGFVQRHGQLVQVELDALDPTALRTLLQDALNEFWDTSAYQSVLAQEQSDLGRLRAAAGGAA